VVYYLVAVYGFWGWTTDLAFWGASESHTNIYRSLIEFLPNQQQYRNLAKLFTLRAVFNEANTRSSFHCSQTRSQHFEKEAVRGAETDMHS